MKRLLLVGLMLTTPALAQVTGQDRAICQEHRSTGTGAPGHVLNWQKGWEACEEIEQAFQASEAGKAERTKLEEGHRLRIESLAKELKRGK